MYNMRMKVVERKISAALLRAMEQFPAVVLTGPRRAGKTFLLKHLFPRATYIQLEDPDTLLAVKEDPRSFLAGLTLPAIIDEVQKVPELFAYVRSRIDAQPEQKGQWILTGSQESLLMEGVSESMAGRAAILRLAPFSLAEDARVCPFTGGYPEALAAGEGAALWYSSYVQTYLERDVRTILAVRNLSTFHRFLKVVATRHGQMLNKTALASPLGISVPTLSEWLNVLEMSGIIALLPPYYRNAGKRLVKTPKLYFLDSGLVCHLLGIRTASALVDSPFSGAVFEGFVVAEALKAQWARGEEGEVYYFRDEQGLEVDLVIPVSGAEVSLIECKSSATVNPSMSLPMRKLAKQFGAEGLRVQCQLVYSPQCGASRAPTVGADVAALSLGEFVARQNVLLGCVGSAQKDGVCHAD